MTWWTLLSLAGRKTILQIVEVIVTHELALYVSSIYHLIVKVHANKSDVGEH